MTREQAQQELGKEVGDQVWGQIDPRREVVVVIGICDHWLLPVYDTFDTREVRAGGAMTVRFKHHLGKGHAISWTGFEWPTRCKVFAVPRGAAVGLDE